MKSNCIFYNIYKFIFIVADIGKLSFKIRFTESDYVKDTDRENTQKQFNTIILKKESCLLLMIVGKKILPVLPINFH